MNEVINPLCDANDDIAICPELAEINYTVS